MNVPGVVGHEFAGWAFAARLSAVDLASMSDAHDQDDKYVVDDFVDDSEITHAHAIHAVLA